jgi:hypothetical protein
MTAPSAATRYRIHGLPVRLELGAGFSTISPAASPAKSIPKSVAENIAESAARLLRPFTDNASGPQSLCSRGIIKKFNSEEVLRSVTPAAVCVGRVDNLAEIYALDERFWLVDERWGICQLNLLKHEWRSWVLDRSPGGMNSAGRSKSAIANSAPGASEILESAVLWPLAQLLKIRGVELIPAISILRGGWAAIILTPYGIDREILRLQRDGYSLIGPRWTALAIREDGVTLLPFPDPRATEIDPPAGISSSLCDSEIALTKTPLLGSESGFLPEALCQAVFIIEPGRRAVTRGRTLASAEETELLRRAWPITELPPRRKRPGSVAGKLACQCRCVSVQLSRQEEDFFQLVESARRRCQDARKLQLSLGNLRPNPKSNHRAGQKASPRFLYGGLPVPSASIRRQTA